MAPTYCALLRKLNSSERSEDRHDCGRMEKNNPIFFKFHPYPLQACQTVIYTSPYPPPMGQIIPLFPLSDDVPYMMPVQAF